MRFINNKISSVSPTDLTRFFESQFASYMDHFEKVTSKEVLKQKGIFRDPPDPFLTLIADMGNQHEKESIAEIEKQEPVFRIKTTNREQAIKDTLIAMQKGEQNIYQAGIKSGEQQAVDFFGYADLLVKQKGKSNLGNHYYMPYDFKVARLPKPSALIQLCCYCDILQSIQGIKPPLFAVITKDKKKHFFKTKHFFDFYSFLKNQFLHFHLNFSKTNMPIPEKSAEHRDWSLWAQKKRQTLDDVSLTAKIRSAHIALLRKANINKLSQLAHYTGPPIKGIRPSTLQTLKTQALLQQKSKHHPTPLFKVLPHKGERRGLERLSPPQTTDIFLEILNYPFIGKEGLEYLYGQAIYEKPHYISFWALNQQQSPIVFKKWLNWVYKRWSQNHNMKIYHYGPYALTALKKLMGKYGTGDKQIDQLLRHQTFIDLKQIVTQALIIGVPSYHLKEVACECGADSVGQTLPASQGTKGKHRSLTETKSPSHEEISASAGMTAQKGMTSYFAGFLSQNVNETKLANADTLSKHSLFLKPIEEHNQNTVLSLQKLYQFLLDQQKKQKIKYIKPQTTEQKTSPSNIKTECEKKAQTLLHPACEEENGVAHLLAHLLKFHIREDKPKWWDYFARLDMNMEEMKEDRQAITSCSWLSSQGNIHKIQFDTDQEIGFQEGDKVIILNHTNDIFNTYTILNIDLLNGFLELSQTNFNQTVTPHTSYFTLVPEKNDYYKKNLMMSLLKTANEFNPSAPFMGLKKCIHDLFLRNPPDIKGHKGPLILNPKNIKQEISQHALNLNNSVLCVQGPPGSGKTYTGSYMILHLLKHKKRVGVTANSHKAILNMLKTLHKINKEGFVFQCQKASRPQDFTEEKQFLGSTPLELVTSNKVNKSAELVGGTAFFFSRLEQEEKYDYLFVDEAGQMSLANIVASARSAKNIVLIGDQNQLEQPIQAIHPQEAGKSALGYYTNGETTLTKDKGLFLPVSYRMHPKVCQFVSEQFYNGELTHHPLTEKQQILGAPSGIKFVPVEHYGQTHSSIEEAKCIAKLYQTLIQKKWINKQGETKTITEKDILIVAPYNVQVACLKRELSVYQNARIASVDKFQGQEALVCILSMTSSTVQEAPRGLSFLLNKNRLNVALSRAKCLSIVVGSPKLIDTQMFSVSNMELMNIYLKLYQHPLK